MPASEAVCIHTYWCGFRNGLRGRASNLTTYSLPATVAWYRSTPDAPPPSELRPERTFGPKAVANAVATVFRCSAGTMLSESSVVIFPIVPYY